MAALELHSSIQSKLHRLLQRLSRKAFRDNYCASYLRTGLAHQIRTLREQRGWDQKTFAKITGRPQSVVSRLENPDYGKYSLQTLLELASDFDVALMVRFVRYSDFARVIERLGPEDLSLQSFNDDTGFLTDIHSTVDSTKYARRLVWPSSQIGLIIHRSLVNRLFEHPIFLTDKTEEESDRQRRVLTQPGPPPEMMPA